MWDRGRNNSIVVKDAFDFLDSEPVRVSGKDIPLPYAENLEKDALPQLEELIQKSKEVCYLNDRK